MPKSSFNEEINKSGENSVANLRYESVRILLLHAFIVS